MAGNICQAEALPPAAEGGGTHACPRLAARCGRGVAAQVEIESKIEAQLKAVHHILVSSPRFQVLSTWV